MNASLEQTAASWQQGREDADALLAGLSPSQFNWKPDPKRWSVGECLEHLNVLNGAYLPLVREAMRGNERQGDPPYRYNLAGRLLINATTPEVKRKLPTTGAMNPSHGGDASNLDPSKVLATYHQHTGDYVAAIREAEGLDLGRIKVRSPFLPLVSFSLGAVFEALAGHNLRHIAQARRVTQEPGFPWG